MIKIGLKDMLLAGTHFGHLTRRWNPKMKKYIFMERNGIYIIDLKKTLVSLQRACDEVIRVVRNGDKVLFVGTKKQARDIIRAEAERCGMFYVNERWLGGTLTNFTTVKKSIKRLKNFEKMATDGTYDKLTKKEILQIEREKEKLETVLGGIKDLNKLPGLMFVVDPKKEAIAVREADRLDIPIVALIDTNGDPDLVDYAIPGNDDAFKSINLITRTIADAVLEGASQQQIQEAETEALEEKRKVELEEAEDAANM
ncbi:30S ribosomal protein S2 [candidate division KSB1 bacterium]|nr:30S ribosomal protein S2 [candidate division KSB1 bacterium]